MMTALSHIEPSDTSNVDTDLPMIRTGEEAPLKIVHIITRFLTAGSEENTTLSCNWFAERGHDVTLIIGSEFTETATSRLSTRVTVMKVPPLVRSIHPVNDCLALIQLISLLRRLSPDVIHTHQSKAGIIGRLASIAVPKPIMIHGIHILPFTNVGAIESALYQLLERAAAKSTDAFVSVSASLRDEALSKGLGNIEDHYVVASGMQLSRFSSRSSQSTAQSRLSRTTGTDLTKRIAVAYVASYEPRKNHLALLRSLAKDRMRFENYRFLLAGGGALDSEIRAAVRRYELNDIVLPLGYVDNVEDVISAADIGIFCSEREGLPRALVQYCSSGKPIVAFQLPGIEAILTDGQNGFICQQNDFGAMFDRVEQLARDSRLRQEMASSSAARDLSEWSVDSMCNHLERVYQLTLQRRRRPNL
jgi:glycosyltransferase involved in cell wall biosynthesis